MTKDDTAKELLVTFKSNSSFFFKEMNGTKPNTFREDDQTDPRFMALNEHPPKKIKIINTENPNLCFVREILDISFYKGYWIISWKHSESETMTDKEKIPEEGVGDAQIISNNLVETLNKMDEERKKINDCTVTLSFSPVVLPNGRYAKVGIKVSNADEDD